MLKFDSQGAPISGVLDSFTGPNVVADAGNRVRYFHYNDLGTVMAQTKTGGIVEGVWEPDWWGNYRWAYAGSPARPELGLTGKMYDDAAGLYYFNARWYDPERGRWMSEEPLGLDRPNLYTAFGGNPSILWDPDGRKIRKGWAAGAACNLGPNCIYIQYDSPDGLGWCRLPAGYCTTEFDGKDIGIDADFAWSPSWNTDEVHKIGFTNEDYYSNRKPRNTVPPGGPKAIPRPPSVEGCEDQIAVCPDIWKPRPPNKHGQWGGVGGGD